MRSWPVATLAPSPTPSAPSPVSTTPSPYCRYGNPLGAPQGPCPANNNTRQILNVHLVSL